MVVSEDEDDGIFSLSFLEDDGGMGGMDEFRVKWWWRLYSYFGVAVG
jgi:hypothetical protein